MAIECRQGAYFILVNGIPQPVTHGQLAILPDRRLPSRPQNTATTPRPVPIFLPADI